MYRPEGFVLPEGWYIERRFRKEGIKEYDVYYWSPLVEGRRRKFRSRPEMRRKLGDFIDWHLFRYNIGYYPAGGVVRNANFALENRKKGKFIKVKIMY